MDNFLKNKRLIIIIGLTSIPVLIATTILGRYVLKKRNSKRLDGLIKDKLNALAQLTIQKNSPYEQSEKSDATSTEPQSPNTWTALGFEEPLVIAMVGLPARGKSYISHMLMRYLKWTGYECELFNVGSYRREMGFASADSKFFSAGNEDGHKKREELAMAVQDYMYAWLKTDGSKRRVAIFDATNTTISRRLALAKKARGEGVFLLFIESICTDIKVLAQNYALKLQNEDYKQMDPEKALSDFTDRVKAYEQVYEPIQDDEDNDHVSYIKMVNVGEKVITRNCTGYLPSQVALYLQNIHIQPRRIYLSLNADIVKSNGHTGMFKSSSSTDTLSSILTTASTDRLAGADTSSKLTESGRDYSIDLARYLKVKYQLGNMTKDNNKGVNVAHDSDLGSELMVLTGTSSVHTDTISHLRMLFRCYNTPLLNELRGGDFQGLTPMEVKTLFPIEHQKRQTNKFDYRYPGIHGESYRDVIERLRPIIVELERQRHSLLIVCHLAVLRCVYAYFMDIKLEDLPNQIFSKHILYELSPGPFGCVCKEIIPAAELPHM